MSPNDEGVGVMADLRGLLEAMVALRYALIPLLVLTLRKTERRLHTARGISAP